MLEYWKKRQKGQSFSITPLLHSYKEAFMQVFILIVFVLCGYLHAEKILIYDEEKGIIQIEKDSLLSRKQKRKKKIVTDKRKDKVVLPTAKRRLAQAKGPGDIHADRKKDPPGLYFRSGLEYYKNHDFENALKNFKYASAKDIKPEYLLWIGKTYRQLDKQVQMFTIMERILNDYPESDVADDALFEMGFYYQKSDNYQNAAEKYKQLIEQYPFGLSYSSRDEFMEVARKQLRTMRGEMISTLKLIGFKGETLSDAYKKFQKANGLEVTGEGDVITVKVIKDAYKNKTIEEEKLAASLNQLKQSIKWAVIFGAVLLLNLIIMIIARVKIVRNRKQLIMFKETLSGLQ